MYQSDKYNAYISPIYTSQSTMKGKKKYMRVVIVRLPEPIVRQLDELTRKGLYAKRSEAIRDMIIRGIVAFKAGSEHPRGEARDG